MSKPAAGAVFGPEDTHAQSPSAGGVIGTGGQGKIDGLSKIVGTAQFVADMTLPRMAHAKLLRSPHAHADIVSIDTTAAAAMPGVLGIMVGTDLPTKHGAIPVAQDETALAVGKVRYIGEPVACVAATTELAAREAARAIVVQYAPLDAVMTIEDAISADKPLIHPEARKPSNVLRRVFQSHGDVDAGFEAADAVLEETYEYPGSTHVPLEPHAALAAPNPDGGLQIWSSTQNPHYVHKTLARVLGLREADIRLIKPAVGAGYGGKCDTFVSDLCAAHLAITLQRPVRLAKTKTRRRRAAAKNGTPAPTRARSPSTCASAGLKILRNLPLAGRFRTAHACSVKRRGQEIDISIRRTAESSCGAWPRSRAITVSRRRRRAAEEEAKFSRKRRSAS